MARPQGFDFRSANDNEMAEFQQLMSYVFADPQTEESPPVPLDPSWTQCAYEGQRLAAISGVYPFIVRLNGKTVPMHGVTAVGTEPEYRRRGLVRQLITDLLHRAKEEGMAGSILLASRGAIYQRFGYGLASILASYEFDPREAEFQVPQPETGSLKRVLHEEAKELLPQIYKTYAKKRNMVALRGDVVWQRFLDDVEKRKAYCIVHMDDDGNPDGYALYRTKWELGKDQEMMINDFAHTNIGAYRSIWNFLISHDLVRNIKWGLVPEDDPAPGLLLEPRCLNRKTWDGIWFRIVDVPQMLASRQYDVDGDVTVTIEGDEICAWNNGTFALSVRSGQASVEEANPGDADLSCSINELATMVSGFASPGWLSQIGRVQVNNEDQLGYINQLFATTHRPELSFGF